ncbi:WXG100 family type VII secretion target [Microbacterium sp. NPDC076768]|uniref:WXG100 family type VII secretion target n=1 Tax=Microbacterium sp. NPDC076768 TaxID=3154858 RepID=UPI0034416E47
MDLKVDPDRLAETAASALASASAIVDSLDFLSGSARDIATRWSGESQNAFARRSSALDAQWRLHAGILRQSSERAAQLAEEYTQADAAGARAVLGL